ncbi:response regulator, partial [bacterium]|nr:response regulator [bacterium]
MKNSRILIVEDETIIAMETEINLNRLGYQVTSIANSGEEAIEKALSEKPDIILMDIKLRGGMDGITAAEQIRNKSRIPIIFVSAYAEDDKLERAKLTLPYGYLLKPVQERDLKVTIEMTLHTAKIEAQYRQATDELRKMRDQLEDKVEERTKELMQAKEEAEAANRAKSDFLAKISHELRNPLHHILSFSKFGIKKAFQSGENKIEGYFKTISESGFHLLNLLNDLLDLSKLESGKMDFRMTNTNLIHIIKEITVECDSSLKEKNITLEVLEPEDPMTLTCDFYKIGQVVRNLISNSIKFTPNGKKIVIYFNSAQLSMERRIDDEKMVPALSVTIEDEGAGIPEEELEAIFEKFVQSSKNKDTSGGTGLGLSICREIVHSHHGKIWAENNASEG